MDAIYDAQVRKVQKLEAALTEAKEALEQILEVCEVPDIPTGWTIEERAEAALAKIREVMP